MVTTSKIESTKETKNLVEKEIYVIPSVIFGNKTLGIQTISTKESKIILFNTISKKDFKDYENKDNFQSPESALVFKTEESIDTLIKSLQFLKNKMKNEELNSNSD